MLRLMLLMSALAQTPTTAPQRAWLDCLDASGRPAKVYGWNDAGWIRYWPNENPHLSAKPVAASTAPTPTGPVVNYGVNLPAPQTGVGESTHTNDQSFAESVISEQEAALPSPGGLLDRFKPKPKPCPGPEPCPEPDGIDEPAPVSGQPNRFLLIVGALLFGAVGLLTLVAVAVVFVVASRPSQPHPV